MPGSATAAASATFRGVRLNGKRYGVFSVQRNESRGTYAQAFVCEAMSGSESGARRRLYALKTSL